MILKLISLKIAYEIVEIVSYNFVLIIIGLIFDAVSKINIKNKNKSSCSISKHLSYRKCKW